MGFVLWAVETALAIAAAYAFAILVARDRGVLDRIVVAIVTGVSTVLSCLQFLALLHQLYRAQLAVLAALVHAAIAVASVLRAGPREALAVLRSDLRAPLRFAADVRARHEIAVWSLVPAFAALTISSLMIWFFRSWTWDPQGYHMALTNYAIQHHSIAWEPIFSPFVEGYVRDLELLSVWNCILPMHNQFDDLAQMPFALLGAAALGAWARRMGATVSMAGVAGALWLSSPVVFLQMHTTHVDVTCASMFVVAVYAMCAPRFSHLEWWLTCVAMGWYAGSKFTGLMHGAMVAPWVAGRCVVVLWRARGSRVRTLASQLGAVTAMLWLGGPIYIRNWIAVHNPTWPYRTIVPITHRVLAGPVEQNDIMDPPFFGAPGSFVHMLNSWYKFDPFWAPDTREGGFGLIFQFLALPCLLIVCADAVRLRRRWSTVPLALFSFITILAPGAWWARYTMPLAATSILALVYVHRWTRSAYARAALSCATAFLAIATYARATPGYITFPKYFARAVALDDVHRAAMHLDAFLWDEPDALRRETELRAGDVIAVDESANFSGEYWARDYRNRVEFVPYRSTDEEYLRRLRALHPRWVGAGRGSRIEWLLRTHRQSFTFMFYPPLSNAGVWRVNDERW